MSIIFGFYKWTLKYCIASSKIHNMCVWLYMRETVPHLSYYHFFISMNIMVDNSIISSIVNDYYRCIICAIQPGYNTCIDLRASVCVIYLAQKIFCKSLGQTNNFSPASIGLYFASLTISWLCVLPYVRSVNEINCIKV